MNKKLLLAGLAALAVAGAALAWFLTRETADHHGAAFTPGVPAVSVNDLVAKPEAALGRDLRVSGRITRQCPQTGCWFFLRSDTGAEIKVEMTDYTPQLPQRVGDDATVEGRLIRFGEGWEFIGKSVEFTQPAKRP